jgi:hypothetical protein
MPADQRDPTDRAAEAIAHALGEDEPAGAATHGETYEDTVESQDEFEGLLRQYGGDFQKAVDAQRRGEKPKREEPGSQTW